MLLNKIRNHLPKSGLSAWTIILIVVIFFFSDMGHHKWEKDEGPNRGVIKHDVKGYYGYLPSVFIYGDHKMEFIGSPGFKNDNRFLCIKLEGQKRLIQYTSGLAILYSPFFLTAHAISPLLGEERDGYNWVYQFFLVMSALFYVTLGLIFLRKLLLKYFSDLVTTVVIVLVALGTNLYYYTVFEGPMPHSYSFAFIAIFVYLIDKWYEKQTLPISIISGFIFGMIVLIRPSNGLVILLLLFWKIKNFSEVKDRVRFLFRKSPLIMVMVLFFVLPWIPQLFYWKSVTGQFFYNSYEKVGSAFYLDAPQTHKMLFSYRKGWFVYTPIMFVSFVSFIFLFKSRRELFWAPFIYMIAMIYVMSSWWAWWFGGGFGSRSMVDTYALMSLPLAALIAKIFELRKHWIKYSIFGAIALLFALQWLQTVQYNHGSIHYVSMDKDAYWHQYFKVRHRGIWGLLSDPDHQLARLGIYYYYDWSEDYDAFRSLGEIEGRKLLAAELNASPKMLRSIHRYARRNDLSDQAAFDFVLDRVYDVKVERKNLQ